MIMTPTKYNRRPNSFPVGYLPFPAIDVVKGDAVEGMGVIRKIVYAGQHEFTFSDGSKKVTAGIEFQTVSTLTGKKLYFAVPMDSILNIMQYATIEDKMELLPLKSPSKIFDSNDSVWTLYLDSFDGDGVELIIE